jgi:YVTN family beta-propeller protein
VSIIDTATTVTATASPTAVTVTATIPLTGMPWGGIATNPVRQEAYVAALDATLASVLTVVDTATFGQIVEIPLGVFEPTGVAVNPAGTRAYVTGGLTDNAVSVVDLDARAELTLIMLHATDAVGPFGVVVHPTLPRLYVANSNDGTVSVIDTTTNAVVATITLGPCPIGCAPNKLALRPDGTRLYVTDDFADAVWVINTASNAIVTAVADVLFPEGVTAHPDGSRVYVAHVDPIGDGRVSEISTATHSIIRTVPVGLDPIGVAVDPGGTNLYVVNSFDDTVTVAATDDLLDQTVVPVGGAPVTFGQFITAGPGTVRFSSGNYSVTEGPGTPALATITVLRAGAPGATITVPYTTAAGTATPGSDYTETSGTLTFGPTDTSRTFQISIQADVVAEGPETVVLTLGAPGGLAQLGDPSSAVLTINDVGGGTLQFERAAVAVSENVAAGEAQPGDGDVHGHAGHRRP